MYLKARIKSDLLCLYTDLGAWHNLDFINPITHGGFGASPVIRLFSFYINVCLYKGLCWKYVLDDDNYHIYYISSMNN